MEKFSNLTDLSKTHPNSNNFIKIFCYYLQIMKYEKQSIYKYLRYKHITYEISVSSPREILNLKTETKGRR